MIESNALVTDRASASLIVEVFPLVCHKTELCGKQHYVVLFVLCRTSGR